MEYGFVYRTSGTLLNVTSGSKLAEINISNIEIDEFCSGSPGGSVVNLIKVDSCYLSIKYIPLFALAPVVYFPLKQII